MITNADINKFIEYSGPVLKFPSGITSVRMRLTAVCEEAAFIQDGNGVVYGVLAKHCKLSANQQEPKPRPIEVPDYTLQDVKRDYHRGSWTK
jgi:hypothetical protein